MDRVLPRLPYVSRQTEVTRHQCVDAASVFTMEIPTVVGKETYKHVPGFKPETSVPQYVGIYMSGTEEMFSIEAVILKVTEH